MCFGRVKSIGNSGNFTETNTRPIAVQHTIHILFKEEKTSIFDTVWSPFAEEYVRNLAQEIELNKIDYVIAPHAEIDHSGALPILMSHIPDAPIYCTENGVKSLKGHYHKDWNFNIVKTGDRLRLGEKELLFIEAPMLHWPDSMFCYVCKA
jgi:flavorubredoxin